jgi:hypothetical protein
MSATLYATEAHWQTMDSAPRTGERVLVATKSVFDGKHRVDIRRWDPDRYAKRPRPFWRSDDPYRILADRQDQPALWAPLPEV